MWVCGYAGPLYFFFRGLLGARRALRAPRGGRRSRGGVCGLERAVFWGRHACVAADGGSLLFALFASALFRLPGFPCPVGPPRRRHATPHQLQTVSATVRAGGPFPSRGEDLSSHTWPSPCFTASAPPPLRSAELALVLVFIIE